MVPTIIPTIMHWFVFVELLLNFESCHIIIIINIHHYQYLVQLARLFIPRERFKERVWKASSLSLCYPNNTIILLVGFHFLHDANYFSLLCVCDWPTSNYKTKSIKHRPTLRYRWMPQAWPAAACRLLTTDHCMWSCRSCWFSYGLQLHEIKQQLIYIICAHSKCKACLACDQQPFKACKFDSHWDKTSCRGTFHIYLRVNRTSCRSIAHLLPPHLINV